MANNLEKTKQWVTDNLTGILAIIAGLVLLGITYKIIISIVLFLVGITLIYFGLTRLKVKKVTDIMDNMFAKIKKFISQ